MKGSRGLEIGPAFRISFSVFEEGGRGRQAGEERARDEGERGYEGEEGESGRRCYII